jgi:drug/metabolite transporter (DMT)-like permease
VQTKKQSYILGGVIITLIGAVLFSMKAVIAKLIYHQSDISVVSLLTLRMLFALPFYIGMFIQSYPGYVKMKRAGKQTSSANRSVFIQSVVIGILGYYVSSLLDFSGLKYISAGLERIILFTYPTFTVVFAALLFRVKITKYQLLALLVSYLGVAVAFAGDIRAGHSTNIAIGSILVFACAITYSLYVLMSGRMIPKMGVSFFTAVAMMSATAGVFVHFLFSPNSIASLEHLPFKIYMYVLLMAVFATVVPSLLLSIGLSRIGSSNVAIISSVGPMATIVQAYFILGENFGWLQGIGTVLVVAGVWIIGRKVQPSKPVLATSVSE